MGDTKKTDPILKPADTHATGGDADLTTQDTHATSEPLDLTSSGQVKPLDTHATSEPVN